MLSDSSLTNILTVSGVSQIRYRAYQQCCSQSSLNSSFTWQDPLTSPTQPTTLITAYTQLIQQNIPCMWQLQPSAKPSTPSKIDTQADNITLELWVFWFDDRHTGLIDANSLLKELDELRMGSFTWENVSSKNTHRSNACTLVTVVNEYKLFVKAIRNLITPYMLKRDALPLGEFFVFPPSYLEQPVGDECESNQSSLLCCTYNIYLASTNLIFQPNTRRIRLRPLQSLDFQQNAKGGKVLLSPSGEYAYLSANQRHLTHHFEDQLLQQWSALLRIPLSQLIPTTAKVPALVAIRMSWGANMYYPSRLVFMKTPTKQSPSALAGMNGTMGYNHGLTEDIAQKWSREMWIEQVVANQPDKTKHKVDYWSYTNPRVNATLAALDSLSTSTISTPNSMNANSPMMAQSEVLMRAMSEPVISSPLMASKSVATPSSPLPKDEGEEEHEKAQDNNGDTPGGGSGNFYGGGTGLRGNQTSLTDFIQQYFGNGSVDDLAMQLNGSMDMGLLPRTGNTPGATPLMIPPTPQQDTLMMTPGQTYPGTNAIQQQQQQSPYNYSPNNNMVPNASYTSPLQTSYTALQQQQQQQQQQHLQQQQPQQEQQQQQQQQQQMSNHHQQQSAGHGNQNQQANEGTNGGNVDATSIDALDTMGYDMSTPWGGDAGLDNLELDLDVTEEDFNFFESEPVKPTTTNTLPMGSTVPNMQSMDAFFPMKAEELPADVMLQSFDFPKTDTTTMTDTKMEDLLTNSNYDGMILDDPKQEIYQDSGMALDTSALDAKPTTPNHGVKQEYSTGNNSSALPLAPSSSPSLKAAHQPDTSVVNGNENNSDSLWPSTVSRGVGREQRLVPPSFAPLYLSVHVNDAKYMHGGKFTYTPGESDDYDKRLTTATSFTFGNATKPTPTKRRKPKDRTYRPDYVPIVKKKRNKKKPEDDNSDDRGRSVPMANEKTDLTDTTSNQLLDGDGDTAMNPVKHTRDDSGDSSSDSGDSTSDSNSDSDDSGITSDSDQSVMQILGGGNGGTGSLRLASTPMKRTPSASTPTTTPGQDSKKESGNDTEDNESVSRQSLASFATTTDGYATGVGGNVLMDDDDDMNDGSTRWIENLAKARIVYLHRLIGDAKITHGAKRRYDLDRLDLDYDTPFAATVAPGLVHSERYRDEDERPLHYLCQQAVLGGYPFTGGLAEISTNGGEVALGESTRMMITRRRDLVQHARGGATHVPCLPCDFDRVTQDFKSLLGDIFVPKAATSDDPLSLNVVDFTSSVSVNGPLNVQQYYELSESNQMHSKYGKYQVKKRRPAEPNFDTLHSPDIVVSRHDEFIEGSPKMIDFWDKLRLEPYSPKKNISYFVVCPNNEELESAVQVFFKGLSTVYETCCLGNHHPGHIGSYRRGTVPVPLLPEEEGKSKRERQLKSYMTTCEQLGTSLSGVMVENLYIVIYMVNPYPNLSSHFDLSKCYDRLMTAFDKARLQQLNAPIPSGPTARFPSEKTRVRLVMQIMPIEHIVRCTDFGSYSKNGLKEIAFSVYSKCPSIVNSPGKTIRNGMTSTGSSSTVTTISEIYAPPFVLTKEVPDHVAFSLSPSLSAPVILDQDATLHMAYGYSLDRRWLVAVWTDHRGELVEYAVLRASPKQSTPFVAVFEEAWKRTKEIASQTDFVWTFVIVKLGLMFENELQAWVQVIPENERAAVVSMDMESSLHVETLDGQEEPLSYYAPDTPQTPQTPNVGPSHVSTPPPTPQQVSSSATTPSSTSAAGATKGGGTSIDTLDTATTTTTTKILLLNHRVAYSRKRLRVSEGVTLMDAVSDGESWILPLASGYLIQIAKQSAPTAASEEQFGRAPCVIELHLVYNQTQHSNYTTLRDIIKRYYALSFVNMVPTAFNCLPLHIVLADRLFRLLLVVDY